MAWRVDGVTRARQWRGTSCEHAIAAARGGTRVGRGRACGLWVGPRRRARGRASSKDAVAYLAVALAPAAVVGLDGCTTAHCHLDAVLAACARAVPGLRCATAVRCYQTPAPGLACSCGALVGGARTNGRKGQPRLGAKHSGRFPTSAAARGASLSLVWERWRARVAGGFGAGLASVL